MMDGKPHQLRVGSSSASRESWIEKFNEYKMETEFSDRYVQTEWRDGCKKPKFSDGYVKHRISVSQPCSSSKSSETSRWERKKLVGSGRFGEIWLEEQTGGREKQLRAVKILPRQSLPDAAQSRELLALVKLNEFDILFVKFLGWYEHKDNTFLAMEYIALGDLGKQEASWGKTESKEITRQILEGLEVLQEKRICHRDLKPQNILVASLYPVWVKITDFGVSKRLKGTVARTLAGTYGYIPPELQEIPMPFNRGLFPYAIDIWSLGCLVHKLLTGKIPFLEHYSAEQIEEWSESEIEPGFDTEALRQYCNDAVFPTSDLQGNVDEEGIDFVKLLLIANPKNRPTATAALAHSWLTICSSDYVRKLRGELLGLGIDLEWGSMEGRLDRQIGQGDIINFLPSSAKAQISSLALDAAEKGYSLAFSRLFRSPSYDLESIDPSARGELFQQARGSGKVDIIQMLLQRRAHVGAFVDDQSVFEWAVEIGETKIVKMLLDNESYVSAKAAMGVQRALKTAIENCYIDIIRLLLENGADVNYRESSYSTTPLQLAAGGGNIGVVQLLLDCKADVNAAAEESEGLTALQAAAAGGHIGVVNLLLDNKADVNAATANGGETALWAAASGGYIDIVDLLLKNQAFVNSTEGHGTALSAAARRGDIDVVKLLLKNKADVNEAMLFNQTALEAAASTGNIDMVKLLLENKADVNATPTRRHGRTALQAAAKSGHIDVVKLLLENKADVNAAATEYGELALQAAASIGHHEMVKLLLENHANVNAAANGPTALLVAARIGHLEVVKLLLENGANVNAAADGQTALLVAARVGNLEVAKVLLENMADVEAKAAMDVRRALQAATEYGHIDVVRLVRLMSTVLNPMPIR